MSKMFPSAYIRIKAFLVCDVFHFTCRNAMGYSKPTKPTKGVGILQYVKITWHTFDLSGGLFCSLYLDMLLCTTDVYLA